MSVEEATRFAHVIRFETFEVNLHSGQVFRDGEKVRLPEQSFQILAMLLERPGEIVLRSDIQKKLWPNDTIVEFENSINSAVKRLRLALEDSADQPRYVETLPRRGYRWLTLVERSAHPTLPQAEVPAQPAHAQPPASNLLGKLVSHYRVLDVLGGGGMGVVYRAEDIKLGRQVALKFLPEELADDPGSMRRFEREARTASLLSHPGICTIYEIEEEAGRPFIVMELLKGQTLRELIEAAADPLPIPKVLDLAKQIVAALDAAHSHGIIHRDIKPANIHVTAQGQAKILDFGLAKSQGADNSDIQSSRLTGPQPQDISVSRSGEAMGTAGYMSPEQVRGEKLDSRTDIYSFGLVLYEMATGRRAFTGDTITRLHAAILEEEPVPGRRLNPRIPEALDTVITTAMQKNREARYPSAGRVLEALQAVEVGDALVAVLTPQAVISEKKRQPPRKFWAATVAAAAVVIVLAVTLGAYYVRQRQAMRLTNQDTIVLADFANSTGEPVFDGALKQATSVALRQSPFLNILSDREVRSTLKLMTRPPNSALTPDIARELCQRAGSKAYVAGAIGPLGNEYVLQLKAVNCLTGRTLAQQQVTAESKDMVLDALSTAATKLRGELGESLATVTQFDVPLRQATTSSLEALKAYSLGYEAHREQGPPAALPHYLRAIQLDPNFAMAYLNTGICYFALLENERANEYLTKAFQLREHASEREKLSSAGMYYYAATGELDSAAQMFQKLIEIYPREVAYYSYLGLVYAREGQYEKAVETERRVYPLAGDSVGFASAMAKFALALQRLDEVQQIFQDLQKRKVDGGEARTLRYALGFVQGDKHALEEQVEWFQSQGDESGFQLQSDTEAYNGHLNIARQMTARAAELALHNDDKEGAGLSRAHAAVLEALFGNAAQARQAASEALKIAPASPGVEIEAALAFARVGDASRAEFLSRDLGRRFPLDTQMQSVWLPTIAAQSLLSARKPAAAINMLQATAPMELGYAPSNLSVISCLYTVHLRAEAYLETGNDNAAASEFQKVLDHKGIVLNCPTGALAHLGMARANALQARKEQGAASDAARTRALTAYQDFFTLWKDADTDVPILKQAKAEYAKLR